MKSEKYFHETMSAFKIDVASAKQLFKTAQKPKFAMIGRWSADFMIC